MMKSNYKPVGYQTVTLHFTVKAADSFIDFLKKVFDAEERSRGMDVEGNIIHAEVRIGDTSVEVSDGNDRFPPRQNTIHIFVGDTDSCYHRALENGATSLYEPADMPYGERSSGVEDAYGNHWYIATFLGAEGSGY
jgi:PhnB protein